MSLRDDCAEVSCAKSLLCVYICRDVIYKVILKLNHMTLNIPATLHAHTPQPPHSMKYKINTALSNKQQKENSNFHFNDMRETRKANSENREQKQKETERERRGST